MGHELSGVPALCSEKTFGKYVVLRQFMHAVAPVFARPLFKRTIGTRLRRINSYKVSSQPQHPGHAARCPSTVAFRDGHIIITAHPSEK